MMNQQTRHPEEKSKSEMVKESIAVRGICAAIQAMALPTFDSLNEMVSKYGYKLVKKD